MQKQLVKSAVFEVENRLKMGHDLQKKKKIKKKIKKLIQQFFAKAPKITEFLKNRPIFEGKSLKMGTLFGQNHP